jgi:hypothetical protein
MTIVRGYHRLLDLEWLNGKMSSLGVGRNECLLSGRWFIINQIPLSSLKDKFQRPGNDFVCSWWTLGVQRDAQRSCEKLFKVH